MKRLADVMWILCILFDIYNTLEHTFSRYFLSDDFISSDERHWYVTEYLAQILEQKQAGQMDGSVVIQYKASGLYIVLYKGSFMCVCALKYTVCLINEIQCYN